MMVILLTIFLVYIQFIFVDIPLILWRPFFAEPEKLLRDGRQPVSFGYFCALSRLSDALGVVYSTTFMGRE